MGRIVSKPKAPSLPPPVTSSGPTEAEKKAKEEQARKDAESTRAEELARARRGIGSTITTSYRGVLDGSEVAPRRKTLLGE